MIESNLNPFLFRALPNIEHACIGNAYDLMANQFEQAPINVQEWFHLHTGFIDTGLELTDDVETAFVTILSNQVVRLLEQTRLPLFSTPDPELEPFIADSMDDELCLVSISLENLTAQQIKIRTLLGFGPQLVILKSNSDFFDMHGFELVVTDSFPCTSFRLFIESSKRNLLSTFNKTFMLQQNTIANELLNGPAIYSDLFKQALRQQICSKLCAEDDLEISVHDKEICDDAGNLYFHIGFNQTFKHQFFHLVSKNILISPFHIERLIGEGNELLETPAAAQSNLESLVTFMLVYMAIYEKEALDSINSTNINDDDVLNMIMSKLEQHSNNYPSFS
ncbi:hypothetical protein NYZ65_14955 [Acinetobacter baumannii]|nr:hypothetical protein [Acinetobacter baumannii]